MGVHSDVSGLKAEVVVDGKVLHEYEDKDLTSPPKTGVQYVEAQVGAQFSLEYVFDEFFQHRTRHKCRGKSGRPDR